MRPYQRMRVSVDFYLEPLCCRQGQLNMLVNR